MYSYQKCFAAKLAIELYFAACSYSYDRVPDQSLK